MKKNLKTNTINTIGAVTTALASGLILTSTAVAGTLAEQVFFFGDSLTDTGNSLVVDGFFPSYPFTFPGRFSNGLVWSDYVSDRLGLNPSVGFSLNPNSDIIPSDGINFAFGGATSSDINIAPNPAFPGLEQQISSFVTLRNNGNNSNTIDPDALYFFWAGANDYLGSFYTPSAISPQSPTTVVNNLIGDLEILAQNGAKRILVGNLPDLGIVPFAQSEGTDVVNALNSLTDEHNLLLEQRLQLLQQAHPNTQFILWDTNTLFDNFFANPQKYGFTDPNVPCTDINLSRGIVVPSLPNFTTCNNGDSPSQLVWWDSQHPTSRTHELIAKSALKRSTIPESSPVFALLILASLLLSVRLLGQKPDR